MAFEGLSEKLNAVFKRLKGKGKLNEYDIKVAMREVRLALLEADVNYKVVKDFVKSVSERAVGAEVLESLTPAQQVIKIVHEELIRLMGSENARIQFPAHPPCVVMMVGLQGSGKTTHSAKLAKYFKGQGHRPLLVACDIYRPAAIEQLKVVGEQAGVPVFELGQRPPLEIAQKAIAHAKDHGNDLVILDTAGRLHIDEALMAEFGKMQELPFWKGKAFEEVSLEELQARSIKRAEEQEQKEFLEEMIPPNLYSMFVTPKDVDETVKYLSFTISEGLNLAFGEV